MDDAQPAQQLNPPHSYACNHQPHLPTNPNVFVRQSRDGSHYDPVHDSSGWYHGANPNAPGRPPHAAPQVIPQWGPNAAFMPISSWHGFTGALPPQGPDPSGFQSSRNFLDMPWDELRGFDPLPYGYRSSSAALNRHISSPEPSNARPSTLVQPTRPVVAPQIPPGYGAEPAQGSMMQQEFLRTRGPQFTGSSPSSSEHNPARRSGVSQSEAVGRPPLPPPTDMRTGKESLLERRTSADESSIAQARARYHNYVARRYDEATNPRRRTGGSWDSDDDDESLPDIDVESYRRNADLLFNQDGDDERSLAAMRGALASSKKVPTKEAIASLELVTIQDLSDKSKAIPSQHDYDILVETSVIS